MDRNEQARMQQRIMSELRARVAMFAQDFASGKAAVLDRFAQTISTHDLVLWHPPHDMVYEVTKIEPVLTPAPNEPIGMIRVTLEMMAPVNFFAGQPSMTMVRVGHQDDPQNAALFAVEGGKRDNEPPPPQYDAAAEAAQQTADRLDGDAKEDARHDPGGEES